MSLTMQSQFQCTAGLCQHYVLLDCTESNSMCNRTVQAILWLFRNIQFQTPCETSLQSQTLCVTGLCSVKLHILLDYVESNSVCAMWLCKVKHSVFLKRHLIFFQIRFRTPAVSAMHLQMQVTINAGEYQLNRHQMRGVEPPPDVSHEIFFELAETLSGYIIYVQSSPLC